MTGTDGTHRFALDRGWSVWRLMALRSAGGPIERLGGLATERELALPAGPERESGLRAATRAACRDLVLDDFLLGALAWQNPEILDNWLAAWVAALRAGDEPQLSRMDRREALIARYAQRYFAKNDTIGFFGPVAWARLGGGPAGTAGSLGVRRSRVCFETWAVRSVVDRWNRDPRLRPFLPVRLNPSCTRDGNAILRPHRPPFVLDPDAAEVVASLPGAGTVAGLEARCGPVAGVLARLGDAGVLRVGFPLPLTERPERALREHVAGLGDAALRAELTALLDRLDAARAAVVAATDPLSLHGRLSGLRREVAVAAGTSARSIPDASPGGRTSVYLDCRRDLDVVLEEALLTGVSAPLGILLDSARWLAGQVGEAAHEELRGRYRRLRRKQSRVTLADLQFAAADLLSQRTGSFADVVEDFQLRWAEILPRTGADAVVEVSAARAAADSLFPPGGRHWAAARVHSPDLMLRDPAADGARWVLGELHLGLNTLESPVFGTQADDAAELTAAVAADLAPGRVVPVYPTDSPEVSPRTYPPLTLDPPGHYRYWSYGFDDGHASAASSAPATALCVEEIDGELIARAEPAGWAAPVLECFGEFLTAVVVNLFQLRRPAPCLPRVTLGDLVVSRRSWRVAGEELAAVAPRRGRDRGQDTLRGWARAQGLPRHVFVRTPLEPKPFYVDFQAPLLVENLARAVGRLAAGAAVDLVEMLPAPEELWLRDDDGRRFTSELRMVAVDPARHGPASWSLEGAGPE
ncbi:lantibiotic dehydratase [Cryptosporangium sp. NPDC051539]|uniref:lantibiotic dehydratase n=1 Tax=Cryptosporangium sp. NPDC051539 TaxID=3363962 RepID=UPI0037937056